MGAAAAEARLACLHFGVQVLVLVICVRIEEDVLFVVVGGRAVGVAAGAIWDPATGLVLGHVVEGELVVWLGWVLSVAVGVVEVLEVVGGAGGALVREAEVEDNLGGAADGGAHPDSLK